MKQKEIRSILEWVAGMECDTERSIFLQWQDQALKDLRSLIQAEKKEILPRKHCACGNDNCSMPMGDYDNGYNDALDRVLEMLR